MKNFAVQKDGKTYWISRSVAVMGLIFKTVGHNFYVLVEKRGKGAADNIGKYCCPCGYVDYDETLDEAICREVKEETGLEIINVDELNVFHINSDPSENHQNITVRYSYYVDGIHPEEEISDNRTGGEKDEVESVEWLLIGTFKDITYDVSILQLNDRYQVLDWAFDHDKIINDFLNDNYVIRK